MPTFLVNSLIDTCPTSPIPQLFEDDIPSVSMGISEKEYFPMSSFITSWHLYLYLKCYGHCPTQDRYSYKSNGN